MIREGWLDSELIGRLSAEAERFFLRLCIASDDAGRLDARPAILKAKLFPLAIGVTEDHVTTWMRKCASVGLIIVYTFNEKPFLQITRVHRSSPAVVSRFPWRDGTHRITYVKRETRDGLKDFVSTSLADGMDKGLVRDEDGSQPHSPGCTGTGTETGTCTEPGPPGPGMSPKGGDKATPPYEVKTDIQAIVVAYKTALGFAQDDRVWDAGNFARASKTAAVLLRELQGRETAIQAIQGVAAWARAAGLSWTIETVLKRAADWRAGRLAPEAPRGSRPPVIPDAREALKSIETQAQGLLKS
jgi:hypothetical protein